MGILPDEHLTRLPQFSPKIADPQPVRHLARVKGLKSQLLILIEEKKTDEL